MPQVSNPCSELDPGSRSRAQLGTRVLLCRGLGWPVTNPLTSAEVCFPAEAAGLEWPLALRRARPGLESLLLRSVPFGPRHDMAQRGLQDEEAARA